MQADVVGPEEKSTDLYDKENKEEIPQDKVVRKPHHVHSWNIELNYLEAAKEPKIKCEQFKFLNHDWLPFIFPHGNAGHDGFLSAYIDCTDLKMDDRIAATFRIEVVNHLNPKKNCASEASHVFFRDEHDRGFARLIKLSDLKTPGSGFLFGNPAQITLKFSVEADANVFPSRYQNPTPDYDSKTATGYVGLRNQGATCYMNSLLQTLFHIPAFRKAVYFMPTENMGVENSKKEIPLALQRLFYHLQVGERAASTRTLTQSFGWTSMDAFMQHDVQEFNRVLCDNLEEKMKKTVVEGSIARLFEGKMQMYIECINVPYKSTRTEPYYDLQMTVKNCGNLLDSFRQYVEVETLQGDNQYRAEKYGLQDARKGTRIVEFPPVLQIQLKRFEYDPAKDANTKINDRFEFPETLDLTPFLSEAEAEVTKPDDKSNGVDSKPKAAIPPLASQPKPVYSLHSILVHSGNVHGGHYYAFIRPFKGRKVSQTDPAKEIKEKEKRDTAAARSELDFVGSLPVLAPSSVATVSAQQDKQTVDPAPALESKEEALPALSVSEAVDLYRKSGWYKFDDDVVVKVDSELAIEGSYGGIEKTYTTHFGELISTQRTKFANAYMLVYVRHSDIPQLTHEYEHLTSGPEGRGGLPRHLELRFDSEERKNRERELERENEHKYVMLHFLAEKSLIENGGRIGIDLSEDHFEKLLVLKEAPLEKLQKVLFDRFGIPPARQQLFRHTRRDNGSRRPNSYIFISPSDLKSKTIFSLTEDRPAQKSHFFLRDSGENFASQFGAPLLVASPRTCVFFLFKFFDIPSQTLRFVGSGVFKIPLHVRDLFPFMLSLIGFGDNQNELIDPAEPGVLAVNRTIRAEELQDNGVLRSPEEVKRVLTALENAHLELFVFEEENARKRAIRPLDPNGLLDDSMFSGDIICFQLQPRPGPPPAANAMDVDEKAAGSDAMQIDTSRVVKKSKVDRFQCSKDNLPHPRCVDVKEYLIYLLQRYYVTFKHAKRPQDEGVRVELATIMQYDDIVGCLGRAIHVDPFHIRLYKSLGATPSPNHISRPQALAGGVTLMEFLRSNVANDFLHEIFYDVLDYSILELDSKFAVDMKWYNQSDLSFEPLVVLVPYNNAELKVRDFIALVCNKRNEKQPNENESATMHPDNVRLILVVENRTSLVFDPQDELRKIPLERLLQHQLRDAYLRAEEIPAEERNAPSIWLHRGYHQTPRWLVTDGEPFSMSLIPMETIADFKKRVQQRLHMPDSQFVAVKLQLETRTVYSTTWTPSYDFVDLTDEIVVSELQLDNNIRRILFCFKPRQVANRDTYYSYLDKPVKIYT